MIHFTFLNELKYICNFADDKTFQVYNKELLRRTLYKIKSIEVLDSTKSLRFLSNRSKRVTSNGQPSNWLPAKAGKAKI